MKSFHTKIFFLRTLHFYSRLGKRKFIGRNDFQYIFSRYRIKTSFNVVKSITSFRNNMKSKVDFTMRKRNHKQAMGNRQKAIGNLPTDNCLLHTFHFESLSIKSFVIPEDENPPSCIKFCIVTMRVKSENRTTI